MLREVVRVGMAGEHRRVSIEVMWIDHSRLLLLNWALKIQRPFAQAVDRLNSTNDETMLSRNDVQHRRPD